MSVSDRVELLSRSLLLLQQTLLLPQQTRESVSTILMYQLRGRMSSPLLPWPIP